MYISSIYITPVENEYLGKGPTGNQSSAHFTEVGQRLTIILHNTIHKLNMSVTTGS